VFLYFFGFCVRLVGCGGGGVLVVGRVVGRGREGGSCQKLSTYLKKTHCLPVKKITRAIAFQESVECRLKVTRNTYRGADKSLTPPGRKQVNDSVRIA